MLSNLEPNSISKKLEYKVTSKKAFSSEWNVTSPKEPNKYLKFAGFGSCTILDSNRNPVGKISSENAFTCKKFVQLNLNSSQIKGYLRPKFSKFLLKGESNIKGFEEISFDCKVNWKNSKFTLISQKNGYDKVIAEFRRSSWNFKEVGTLCIFEDFPPDINSLIIYSICYCISHKKKRKAYAAANSESSIVAS